ncbi:F0F1 ATP synthase subunit delta [Jeotgalibaca sp. MA1X17-3]|uniref:F0F1 ATP synthase subunit delta n=1 Tax=Jeotgalibaca sp. MA1X17-3 TaxID=2908211 RepID=UPI001F306DCD|nr:F0F1 ATP synthase subunit delta [Jeotgalibaca sp. MA1X17-3]UJF16549.1 F0F1 ATP synthase subunit delta [Jeotgalibaca sp. MA1X17-3]
MVKDNKENYDVTAFVRSHYNTLANSQIADKIYNEMNLLFDGLQEANDDQEAQKHLEKLVPYLSAEGVNFLSGLEENVEKDGKISIEDMVSAIEEFRKLHEKDREPVDVTLTSAVPLNREQKERVIASFRKKVGGHHLFIHEVIDQDVVGGVRLETENYYYDNTIVKKLKEIKEFILNDE